MFGFGFAAGAVCVAVLWIFWPKISTWLSGETTKVEDAAKAEAEKIKGKL